ncbi:MAG: sodium:calcium antiporter, partial [Dehalococcoidia bacterium]
MAVLSLPGIVLRFMGVHPEPWIGALVFGLAILAAVFLLSWAAETAEMDISQGLALAIIAVIAVLPEYAVDAVLAWKAGASEEEAAKGLAVANMTGGNRLLIGIGWPAVFVLFLYRTRIIDLVVSRERALELVFLAVATVYVIFIPLRDHISLADTMILVTIFVIYMVYVSRMESEHIELL